MTRPAIPPSRESLALWEREARLAAGIETISKLYGIEDNTEYDTDTVYGWAVDYRLWSGVIPPPTKWLIPNYWPAGAVATMSGQSKWCRKTTTAMHMAFSVSTGVPFAGHQPEIVGPVLYVLEEGSWSENWCRLEAIRKSLGLRLDDCTNLKIAFKCGLKLNSRTPGVPNEWLKKLLGTIMEHNIVAVVLDTFSYMFYGDENKTQDLQDCIKSIQAVQKTGASILVLTHLRKYASAKDDPNEQIRGSSILRDILDFHLALRSYGKNPDSITLDVIDRYGPPRPKERMIWSIVTDRDDRSNDKYSLTIQEIKKRG